MQRSITYKKPLEQIVYLLLFVLYESLSSIYLFLPPLFAVLFIFFAKAVEEKDIVTLLLVSFCLLVFEANKGYLIFSSIIYFALVYKFVVPWLMQNFNSPKHIQSSYAIIVYLGFYFFNVLLSNIFLIPMPSIDYYIVYYIVIEFFLVSLL